MLVTPENLRSKILSFYPEITKHQIELTVHFDKDKKAWVAQLSKQQHELTTIIDPNDAQECINGIECVHLGTQIGQFIFNYCSEGDECKVP
ncbi:hypothetical protein [Halodesulfovibrio marinisediminis]|uniref:Uncharacterized protein n=1 Tax=Halodesulfovibrio marinisediminis DSM 17456 TaxID=1121457 RepID=A0A1N6DR17_9BACT|nr:hypothetical protein [Halodesulfovibrio marinisediminis]SIN73232.1 hypothetical protein SAMN02745161_0409 [Halodesulfovibrio marinisediminis DSM 17456]